MPLTVDYVSDWAGRLFGRLYEQFKDSPNLVAVAQQVLGPQFQDLENAFQTLWTLSSIDDSSGVQLDVIGRYVGQPRSGVDDVTYRLYLKTRILANRSNGTAPDLLGVLRVLVSAAARAELVLPMGTKHVWVQVNVAVTTALAFAVIAFMHAAREAGTALSIATSSVAYANTLTFDSVYGSPSTVSTQQPGSYYQANLGGLLADVEN